MQLAELAIVAVTSSASGWIGALLGARISQRASRAQSAAALRLAVAERTYEAFVDLGQRSSPLRAGRTLDAAALDGVRIAAARLRVAARDPAMREAAGALLAAVDVVEGNHPLPRVVSLSMGYGDDEDAEDVSEEERPHMEREKRRESGVAEVRRAYSVLEEGVARLLEEAARP